MYWTVLLFLLGAGLIVLAFILLKRRITSKKEEDIVAYYLDLAYHLPESLYLAIAGLIMMIAGVIVMAI